MKHKKILIIFIVALLLEFAFSYLARKYAIPLGICETGYTNGASKLVECSFVKGENFITLLDLLSLTLLPIFLVLLFCKEAVYKSWVRFARIALPVLVFFSLITAGAGGGNSFMSAAFISIDGEFLSFFFAGLFLIISFIIIIKSIRAAKNEEK